MGVSLNTDGGADSEQLLPTVADVFLSFWGREDEAIGGDPLGHFVYPVFEDLSREGDVVAVIVIFTLWRQLFLNILPPDAVGVIVLFENTCDQVSPSRYLEKVCIICYFLTCLRSAFHV